jgi:hypothetical protein
VKRAALFDARWVDTPTGQRIERATRQELAAACRLWWRHSDIRESKVRGDEIRKREGAAA